MRRPSSAACVRSLLRTLLRLPCVFRFCEGPQRPQDMVTCVRCQAIREARDHLRQLRGLPPFRFEPTPASEARRERRIRKIEHARAVEYARGGR